MVAGLDNPINHRVQNKSMQMSCLWNINEVFSLYFCDRNVTFKYSSIRSDDDLDSRNGGAYKPLVTSLYDDVSSDEVCKDAGDIC